MKRKLYSLLICINVIKKLRATFAVTVMMAAISITAFAAGWQQNSNGWWYATNADNTEWYSDGWQWIDGNADGIAECYYFDANGMLVTNGYTPDGYEVNADGAWILNGVIQTQAVSASVVSQAAAGAATTGSTVYRTVSSNSGKSGSSSSGSNKSTSSSGSYKSTSGSSQTSGATVTASGSSGSGSSSQGTSDTVYWTKKGKSWHRTTSCPTLSRSKNILSGSMSECPKSDACNVCT